MIDEEKLTEFNELMGYYQIATSETEMDDLEIIDKYHGLTQIEDQFREMKGTLETRPIYVNTPEHIQAHLLICFMALTMMRVMQHKIKKSLPENTRKDLNWSYGLPGHRLSKALLNWQVEQLSAEYFRMVNVASDGIKLILKTFGLDLPLPLAPQIPMMSITCLPLARLCFCIYFTTGSPLSQYASGFFRGHCHSSFFAGQTGLRRR